MHSVFQSTAYSTVMNWQKAPRSTSLPLETPLGRSLIFNILEGRKRPKMHDAYYAAVMK